ncbi:ShlB/FhaC/HecB family hemolysin secretion/activation protein [Peristeroidobacter soli]|uniref:ShlB/FhaC/HecB family hemolysin secretion/activation protein n=1 Tax=Peristeroidobacter soli TaxID=2497877 RepID=UPI00158E92FC|nr:ShlB/FhaC/HecB family hemolysin secretion/activation protein [Peristeroidobacter soli]
MTLRSATVAFLSLSVIASPRLLAQEVNADTPQDKFAITEYRVLGNTVLPATAIETVVYPFLGEGKTIADVEVVRQALEKLYKDRGFGTVFVDIPEQTVNEGIVRLKVTEGRLDRVRITGARYFANGAIRSELTSLQPGTVLSLPELQNQLGEVNQQSRDRSITPVLKAGRSPGTVDIELKVQDSLPVHGSVEVNDRYSANTTHTRASVNLSYDNLWQKFHSLSLQYQTSPEDLDETRVIAGTYLMPLSNGNLLAVYAVDTNSDFAVVNTGGDLSVLGTGNIYGLRYIARLPLLGGYSQNVTLGADYKDFKDDIVLSDGKNDTTPIRYMSWTAGYSGVLGRDGSTTGFNLNANFGMRGVINNQAEFTYKRADANASFFYLRGDASHLQSLWSGSAIYVKAVAQWAPDPLISNEQFASGGAEGVRGYVESALMGDRGIGGTIELRSPSMHAWFGNVVRQLTTFIFYDAAHVTQLAQVDDDGNLVARGINLYSAGAGLRLTGFGGLEAALDWAYPLRDWEDVEKGDSRIHFRVRYAF